MTPRSRDHGREYTADRPAAHYTAGEPERDAAVLYCQCGAMYRDYPDSHAAHKAVHGHRPIVRPQPKGDDQ